MNRNESRYFRTAVKMDEALICLLDKKDFEYITIKEICQTAGVNRSTFYLHYENTVDLLKETTRYITDGFLRYFPADSANIPDLLQRCPRNDLVFIRPKYLHPYLSYIKENQRIFRTAVRHIGTMGFEEIYGRMSRYIFDPVLERFDFPPKTHEYVMRFYLTGITALVMEWMRNNCAESIEVISDIITQCVLGKVTKVDGDGNVLP